MSNVQVLKRCTVEHHLQPLSHQVSPLMGTTINIFQVSFQSCLSIDKHMQIFILICSPLFYKKCGIFALSSEHFFIHLVIHFEIFPYQHRFSNCFCTFIMFHCMDVSPIISNKSPTDRFALFPKFFYSQISLWRTLSIHLSFFSYARAAIV